MQISYSIKEETLLVITYLTIFGQIYQTRKKRERKKKKENILFYKQDLITILKIRKGVSDKFKSTCMS
jgi:hypothetical protein